MSNGTPDFGNARVLKAIDLLAKEYEFHRSEAIKRLEVFNQQNTYIQVFIAGVIAAAFAVVKFSHASDPKSPEGAFWGQIVQGKQPLIIWGMFVLLLGGAFTTW